MIRYRTFDISLSQLILAVRYLYWFRSWSQWSYWYNARPEQRSELSPEPVEFSRASITIVENCIGKETCSYIRTWLHADHARQTLDTLELFFRGAPQAGKKEKWDIAALIHWWQRVASQHHRSIDAISINSAICTYFQAFAASDLTKQILQSPIEKALLTSEP